MNYKIGDKVELKSGKIVTITYMDSTLKRKEVYYWGNNPYMEIDEEIVRKIED